MNLEKVQECTCGKKQATKIYFTASTIVLSPLQLTNKSNKSLNKSHCGKLGMSTFNRHIDDWSVLELIEIDVVAHICTH